MSSGFKEIKMTLMAAGSGPKSTQDASSTEPTHSTRAGNDLTKGACNSGILPPSFQDVCVSIFREKSINSGAAVFDGDRQLDTGHVAGVSSSYHHEETFQQIQEPLCKMPKLNDTAGCRDEFRLREPETSTSHDQFMETCDEVLETLFTNVSSWEQCSPSISSSVNDVNEEERSQCDSNSKCDLSGDYGREDVYVDVEENLSFELHETETLREVETNSLPPHQEAHESGDDDKAPLYPSAKITIGSTIVLLVLFTIKYNLAADAIGHLLSLLSLILPSRHILPTSLNNFKNYFRNIRSPLVFHYYCSFCLTYVSRNKPTETVCPNGGCLKDLTAKGALSYFIEIPIIHQLCTFFSREGFYEEIQHRFSRTKSSDDTITYVYNGVLYKELCDKGILNSKDNISFIMNTDGVPVFKSSKVSIWPVFMIINELPYRK